MNSRHNSMTHNRTTEFAEAGCSNIPIECLRKMRSLNLGLGSCPLSSEVYKILKSNNGRKIFT